MRRSFIQTFVQQEGRIAAHHAVEAMEEQPAQIGGGRQLTDVFNVALPARQRRGAESAVFGAVIDAFDPDLEPVVQLIERERAFGIEIGDELLPDRAEAALDLAAAPRADTDASE